MAAVLTFEEEGHVYKIDGVVVPSVTQVIKEAGLMDLSFVKKEVLEYKSDLGKKVHSTTELYDNNNLDFESLHPVLKGYLNGWIKFRKEYKFTPLLIELKTFHPLYRYTGRVDRIGMIDDGKFYGLVELDIKSGVRHHSYAIQSAGYTELYNFGKVKPEQVKRRYTIYLKEDGTYDPQEHKNQNDKNIFLSALTVTNYKRSHK